MCALIITSLIGLVLFGIKTELFVSPFNRIAQIGSLLLSLIPYGAGITYMVIIIFVYFFSHRINMEFLRCVGGSLVYEVTNEFDDVYVRDNKLNRWLFNDIDWEEVDRRIQYSIEHGEKK